MCVLSLFWALQIDPCLESLPKSFRTRVIRKFTNSLLIVSRALGGKEVLPPAFQYIPSMHASCDWRLQHVGLTAIAAIGEGTSNVRLPFSLVSLTHMPWLDIGDAARARQSRRVRHPHLFRISTSETEGYPTAW